MLKSNRFLQCVLGLAGLSLLAACSTGQAAQDHQGLFLIKYRAGKITSVSVQRSLGSAALDARTAAWIQKQLRVKPGKSGSAVEPVLWQTDKSKTQPPTER
jgi:hypothetical protein